MPTGRSRARSSRRALWVAAGILTLSAATPARPNTDSLESAVKAAYLCKFPDFVSWPPDALGADGFVLCVVGQGPFGNLIERAAQGQSVQQHAIVVRRYPSIAGNPGCNLLFAAGSGAQSVSEILAVLRGSPVLTVTDGQTEEALGIINFVMVDGRVRFEINRSALAQTGLAISSKLLSLAVRVRDTVPP